MTKLNLYEKNGHYYAECYNPDRHPKRKYHTLRTRDKRVGMQKLAVLEGKLARGEWDPWVDKVKEEGVLLDKAINRYIAARDTKQPKTLRADRSTLFLFSESLPAGFMLGHVEPRHIIAFLDRKDLSNATLHTYHTRLKAFLSWCVDQGWIERNPLDRIQKRKIHRKEKRFLTQEQYERLIRCIEADAILKREQPEKHASLRDGQIIWLADVVRFAIGTGLRISELCSMRWSWVSLGASSITVRCSKDFRTKSGHERSIPVRGEALDVLKRLHAQRTTEGDGYVFTGRQERKEDREQLNPTYVSKQFKRYVRLAKLPEDYSFHSLRHTYVSWMIQKGVPVPIVQKLAGHADIATTMGYAHLAPDSLSIAVERVFGAA